MGKILCLLVLFFGIVSFSQTGINVPGNPPVPHASAALEVYSTNKGILIPRLSNAQMTAMAASGAADEGIMIYNTDQNLFYYYNGTIWSPIGGTCIEVTDENGDTRIEVEQTADEDKVRITAAGTEVVEISNTGVAHKAGNLKINNGTLAFGNQYSLPVADGNSGDVLSVNNSREVAWRNPAAALGLVVGIETSSFTNVMSIQNINNNVFYVRVMPWSNIRVTQMAFFMQNTASNAQVELGIYNSSNVLIGSGVSDIIPNTYTNKIVEVKLNTPVDLVAGQIYWFSILDKLNGNLTIWRYTAASGAEFSVRYQNSEPVLPATAVYDGNSDIGVWMIAY